MENSHLLRYRQFIHDFTQAISNLGASVSSIGSFTHQGQPVYLHASNLGTGSKRMLITAGVHGEEPAGPLGLLGFVKNNLHQYLKEYAFTIIPVLNPVGFEKGKRRGSTRRDLNRYFGKKENFPENKIIEKFLTNKKFDHHIDMHEDSSEDAIYMYETGNGVINEKILAWAYEFLSTIEKRGIPVNQKGSIYGAQNSRGVIYRKNGVKSNARLRRIGALVPYLIFENISQRGTTLETPALVPLEKRVQIQIEHLDFWLKR